MLLESYHDQFLCFTVLMLWMSQCLHTQVSHQLEREATKLAADRQTVSVLLLLVQLHVGSLLQHPLLSICSLTQLLFPRSLIDNWNHLTGSLCYCSALVVMMGRSVLIGNLHKKPFGEDLALDFFYDQCGVIKGRGRTLTLEQKIIKWRRFNSSNHHLFPLLWMSSRFKTKTEVGILPSTLLMAGFKVTCERVVCCSAWAFTPEAMMSRQTSSWQYFMPELSDVDQMS